MRPKPIKSSIHDLRRLFEQSITVRDIAEPLASFDDNTPSDVAKKFMIERSFDVVGVRCDGAIRGYARIEDLEAGLVGEHLRELSEHDTIRETDPLLMVIERMSEKRWIFVQFLGNPSGIVTRGDLEKAPVRMWLFGLVSLLEMQLLRRIMAHGSSETWWWDLISEKRRENAKNVHGDRNRRNEEASLASCLQLGDKASIFRKTAPLFEQTGFKTKQEWADFMRRIENLRNNLAHSNAIAPGSWPETCELVFGLEELLEKLERSE
jgi:CBS domain-containing protein